MGYHSSSRYPDSVENLSTIVVVLVVLLAFLADPMVYAFTQNTLTVTVQSTAIVGEDGLYLVYAERADGVVEVFENEDCLWNGKFNSSDIQFEMANNPGAKYEIFVYGARVPLISAYRRICFAKRLE